MRTGPGAREPEAPFLSRTCTVIIYKQLSLSIRIDIDIDSRRRTLASCWRPARPWIVNAARRLKANDCTVRRSRSAMAMPGV